ncbi:MAG: hypothetical protein CMM46_14520 [Rhodospirillaceae bacterium]|nr:hypothetical protein [Rhodospirillaceae bacterium]
MLPSNHDAKACVIVALVGSATTVMTMSGSGNLLSGHEGKCSCLSGCSGLEPTGQRDTMAGVGGHQAVVRIAEAGPWTGSSSVAPPSASQDG